MRRSGKTAEQLIAELARRAHGVVTHADLIGAGVTRSEIRHRLRTGALLREYPGVYRVGHRAPSLHARYLAAVRACGDGSLLSGRAAGHLLGLLNGAPPPPEVSSPTQRCVAGVVTHHLRSLSNADGITKHGIPVTTVPRTLVDLAAALPADELARACHKAGVRYGTTPGQVEAVLRRRPNSPGAAKLRRILLGEERVTLSRLESKFQERLREAVLPLPETNRRTGTHRVDCRWPRYRLTVELDSYRYHGSRHAWEQDLHREREARARGDEFRRYTYGDVFETPRFMLTELTKLLR